MSAPRHTRRLSTDVQLCPEAQQLEAKARQYTKERRGYIQDKASAAGVSLKPLEMDAIYNIADSTSQGALSVFKETANRELADFLKKNPDRVRYSALVDWMNEDMNDQEKARREIASWLDNPKIAYFDTETTGFYDEGHVPITAAACSVESTKLVDIQLAPLNEKGEPISITEGASKANHLTDAILAGYQPLEENEWAIRELEILAEGGYILTGYNAKFDRDMMTRAIQFASTRTELSFTPGLETPENKNTSQLLERLTALLTYFKQPEHWLETKDTFCRAVGEEPYPGPGKYLKLEDIAHRTNTLAPGETQAHGALADCQLIARIVRNIRKELEDMAPKPKAAPVAKQTEEVQTEPESTGLSAETQQYIDTLENSLNEAQARIDAFETDHVKMGTRIRELENLCEQYAQDETVKHHEARDVTWSDIEINGFQFNFTRREGITIEQSIEAIMDHIRIMQALKANEKVVTLRVGLKGDWKPLKGFDKPTNGQKPADDNYQPPANDRPATPKGNQPPAANKPNVPAPAKPANALAPQQQPAGNPQGKTTGEKKQQQCSGIKRGINEDGKTYKYSLTFLIKGEPAQYPLSITKKRDVETLETALREAGYSLDAFNLGVEYDFPMLVEWTVGGETKPGSGKFFRDNMTFTIQAPASEEEMPF